MNTNMKKIILTILGIFAIVGIVLATETAVPGYQLLETYLTSGDLAATSSLPNLTTIDGVTSADSLPRAYPIKVSSSTVDKDGQYVLVGATSTLEYMAPFAMTCTQARGHITSAGTMQFEASDGSNYTENITFGTSPSTLTLSTNNSWTQDESFQFDVLISADNTVAIVNLICTTD